ncbi:lipin, N-terminal conserved region-domain-containing protein [Chytriomyces sp. MP71]|nr:lipin, N-terminal conserved region-domain-containing protein [Chytriomyces sp. MP71]
MWKVVSSVADFWGDINPATLSGAIDIVVVRGVDGSLSCSPFHVRFGKLVLLRPTEKKVEIAVNGVQVDIPMKVGEAGEAFFVVEMDDERDPAPSEYATSPIIKGALAFSEGPVEALELGDTSVSKEGEGDLDENDTSIKKDTFDDENEAQVPVKSILLNDAPLDNHIAELDSTQEGMDMSSRYIPVGSPGWQWNWGGLPKKKEGVSENPGDNDAHLGTSAVKEGVTIASSIHANAGSSSMSVTAGTDFGLNEKVPIPTKPPVTSSLTAALQKEGVSPTSTGIIPESAVIDVDQPSVTVDEKVDNYLSSFPDLMAAPDKPPSLRATSPSPMMHAETQIEMATAPLVSFPSDLSDSSHQLELSLCGNNAIASALYSQGPTTAAASAAEIFKKYEVTFDSFIANPAMLSTNQNLVLRLNGSYYDWSVVAPVLVAAVAFGKSFPEEELRRLILSSSLNDKAIIASVGASGSGGGSEEPRRYSSFGNLRSWWSRPTATTNSASPAPGTSPQPQTSPAPGVVPLQPTASGLSAVAEALTANDLAGSLAPSVDGAASGSVDDDRAVSHRE